MGLHGHIMLGLNPFSHLFMGLLLKWHTPSWDTGTHSLLGLHRNVAHPSMGLALRLPSIQDQPKSRHTLPWDFRTYSVLGLRLLTIQERTGSKWHTL